MRIHNTWLRILLFQPYVAQREICQRSTFWVRLLVTLFRLFLFMYLLWLKNNEKDMFTEIPLYCMCRFFNRLNAKRLLNIHWLSMKCAVGVFVPGVFIYERKFW